MQLMVDAVVFTVLHEKLHLLLVQRGISPFKGMYALPGGHVEEREELADAIRRELHEETGVTGVFFHQFGAYGAVGRDPRERTVSVAFLGLIPPDHELVASTDAAKAEWLPADDLPELAFDHIAIVSDALKELRFLIQTTNIAFQILPKKFTLTQLQQLYEGVLGETLDKRNFRKRIAELNLVKPTSQYLRHGAHRPAMLYRFAHPRFQSLKDRMHVFL